MEVPWTLLCVADSICKGKGCLVVMDLSFRPLSSQSSLKFSLAVIHSTQFHLGYAHGSIHVPATCYSHLHSISHVYYLGITLPMPGLFHTWTYSLVTAKIVPSCLRSQQAVKPEPQIPPCCFAGFSSSLLCHRHGRTRGNHTEQWEPRSTLMIRSNWHYHTKCGLPWSDFFSTQPHTSCEKPKAHGAQLFTLAKGLCLSQSCDTTNWAKSIVPSSF
jgi:hypothetical protein